MAARAKEPGNAETEDFERPVRTRGRPSEYTPELATRICERMVDGETLRKICQDEDIPSRGTIFRWLTQHPEFEHSYKMAIELHADWMADKAQEIADDRSADFIEKEDGKLVPDWENVQRSRLRVDTIKWRTAKLCPKKYSDRTQISGPDEKPLTPQEIPLMPNQVEQVFADTLDRMESEMDLHPNGSASPEERIRIMLASGQPVPPELYQLMQKRHDH
jgi:hypothetical protein